jgi:glycosyltransferase involved in cell wall biosynthesis
VSCCVAELHLEHDPDGIEHRGEEQGLGARPGPPGATHMAVIGVSESEICGARDHATLLAEALRADGVQCTMHWFYRSELSARGARAEIAGWARQLRATLKEDKPDALIFHYSVFSYSYRGVPVLIAPVLSALRSARVPVLGVFHELVYPFRYGGWRGAIWALTQRAALVRVVRRCDAVLVTADSRAQWLRSRPWLPKRPLAVAPVFSNLPPPQTGPGAAGPAHMADPVIGLFGYSYQGAGVDLAIEALGIVVQSLPAVQLRLLGAPGPNSAAADAWLSAARRRGVEHVLSFSGTLPAQELSDALAACDVLLFPDTGGPSSRKGSLAGSLASGSPVVAVDGPRTWTELVDACAIALAAPTADALAATLMELLGDVQSREGLGARGQAFARSKMGTKVSADAVRRLYDQLARPPQTPRS